MEINGFTTKPRHSVITPATFDGQNHWGRGRGRTRPNTRYYIQVFLKTNLYFSPDTKLKNSLEDTRKERERETNRHEREKSPSSAKTAGKDGGTKQANETGWKMEMETIAAKEERDWKLKMERAIRRSKQEGDGETGEERERERRRKERKEKTDERRRWKDEYAARCRQTEGDWILLIAAF